jgi:hypothetical protein
MEISQTAHDSSRKIRIGKLELGLNLIIQIIVWLLIVGMINYWSSRHFWRFDWGRNTNLELSPQTKALLENLPKPLKVIVFFRGLLPEAESDTAKLLREYEFASKGKLTRENVDPDIDIKRAMELASHYKFGGAESILIFDYDGRNKFVNSAELADMEPQDPMANMQRRMQGLPPLPPPRMLAFKGEQVMTSAILELTEAKQNKVYFINGHGEHEYNRPREAAGRTLNTLKQALSRQNFLHASLNLAEVDKIPADANAVLILGPKLDFGDRDLKILSEYWDRKGRILMCLPPAPGRFPKLNGWLAERGVTPRNDDVLRVQSIANLGIAQIHRAGMFVGNSVVLKGLDGGGFETDVPFQSFVLDRAKEKTAQLRLTELMAAPQGFWGEVTPFDGNSVPRFDPNVDHQNPLTLAVQVEKGASADPSLKLDTARLIVFGTGDMLTDRGLEGGPAALEVCLNSMNWLLSRENLISLPPKTKTTQSFALMPEQLSNIGWWVMAYLPLFVALFGLYYLWWRHSWSLFVLTAWLAGIFLLLTGAWYLLLYCLGDPGAKSMPKGLIIALSTAVVLGGAAIGIHFIEQNKRLAAQK